MQYFHCIHYYCQLFYFSNQSLCTLLKRLITAALLNAFVSRFCSSKLAFCIPYRWPPIHNTRLPALPSLVTLPFYTLTRSHMCEFRSFMIFLYFMFFTNTYLDDDSVHNCCCGCLLFNLQYVTVILRFVVLFFYFGFILFNYFNKLLSYFTISQWFRLNE